MIPNAVCPRRKAVPFCPPLAFKLQKGGTEEDYWPCLRVSQCYLGTDPRAGSGFGCPDLGHLCCQTWAGLGQQVQTTAGFILMCMGWVGSITYASPYS